MHKGGFYKLLSIDFILISSRFPCGRRAQRFAKRAQKDTCVFCRATATLLTQRRDQMGATSFLGVATKWEQPLS